MKSDSVKELLKFVRQVRRNKVDNHLQVESYNLVVRVRSGHEYLLDALYNVNSSDLLGSVSTGRVQLGEDVAIALDAIESIRWVKVPENPTPIRLYWGQVE